MNHWVLVGSSFLFLIPVISFELYKTNKPIYEYYLAKLLLLTFTMSILFWSNPIRHGIVHKVDAVVARITSMTLAPYIIFMKLPDIYIGSLFCISAIFLGLMIYSSNYCSEKEWCSPKHIMCHFMFHIFSVICIIFAFI